MKIAILGKGGSGKSTVSWLLTQHLTSDPHKNVLAIDADHNMDLTSCLGFELDNNTKYFYTSNKPLKKVFGLTPDQKWQTQFDGEYKKRESLVFTYRSADSFLQSYFNPIKDNLDLIIVGLGEENIMYTNMCSHGLSSPLKYLLPRLETQKDSYVVLDSVAGSDMVNYGLYFGFDVVAVVVEGHINSIKVAKQLDLLLHKQGIKLYFILNKYNSDNQLLHDFQNKYSERVLGNVPIDIELMNYNYSGLSDNTKSSADNIVTKMEKLPRASEAGYELLKAFEETKSKMLLTG